MDAELLFEPSYSNEQSDAMCYGLIDGRIQLQLLKTNEIICLDWGLEFQQEMNVRQIEANVEA